MKNSEKVFEPSGTFLNLLVYVFGSCWTRNEPNKLNKIIDKIPFCIYRLFFLRDLLSFIYVCYVIVCPVQMYKKIEKCIIRKNPLN